jgi:glycosyltransferase involved in cell wall biosynthesis
MTLPRVAAFTDTYLPTVNGVTYTVRAWRKRWERRGGRMDVVYPDSDHDPAAGEHPVRSLPFPWYDGFRVGLPGVPDAAEDPDLVHAHTPFGVGLGALRVARAADAPLVASYHTPCAEYAEYLPVNGNAQGTIRRLATEYERRFLDRADVVVAPSDQTARRITGEVGVDTEVTVIPNGVDTDFFTPEAGDLRDRLDLPAGPLVGYTGRHGHEKRLDLLVEAAAELDRDVTLVLGGDGPAREDLERAADERGIDARFLGFLDREDLPAFYATLDVFGFPSPVETQGLVALEANACGTPVAGVDAGALADTIDEGETGYKAPADDPEALAEAIDRTLAERDRLSATCLDRRTDYSVDHAVDRLETVYARLHNGS